MFAPCSWWITLRRTSWKNTLILFLLLENQTNSGEQTVYCWTMLDISCRWHGDRPLKWAFYYIGDLIHIFICLSLRARLLWWLNLSSFLALLLHIKSQTNNLVRTAFSCESRQHCTIDDSLKLSPPWPRYSHLAMSSIGQSTSRITLWSIRLLLMVASFYIQLASTYGIISRGGRLIVCVLRRVYSLCNLDSPLSIDSPY